MEYKDFIKIFDNIATERKNSIDTPLEELCKYMDIETIEFINNAYKIHEILLKKYESLDKIYVHSKEQLIDLSILISSFYSNGIISKYLKMNKIEIENIEIIFDINLEYENINEIKIDEQNLKKFITITH